MDSSQPAVADSVRLALPGEAGAIAAIQRRRWAAELPAAVADRLLAALSVEEMTSAWQAAITRPPNARCRVLVAVEAGRVVGYATTLPSPDGDADAACDGAIEEFGVDPPAQRRGHGSRLLNAAVDTLRSDGFARASAWLGVEDDQLRGFLTEAGWALDGSTREIGTEDESVRLRQVRLHTDVGAEPEAPTPD